MHLSVYGVPRAILAQNAFFGTKHAAAGRPVQTIGFCRYHPPQHCAVFTIFSRDLGGPIERNLLGASFCPRCS